MQAVSPWFETARLISWIRKVRADEQGGRSFDEESRGEINGPSSPSTTLPSGTADEACL